MLNDDLRGLLNKAYFYLKFRLRTVEEIRWYLYKKIEKTHWSRADVDKVVNHLIDIGLLDDRKFIEAFVKDRETFKPKSGYLLTQELLQHRLDKNLIDEYFAKNPIDEKEMAEKALSSYWSRFKDLPQDQCRQKSSQFLLRRGFRWEIVKKTINKLMKKTPFAEF